MPTRLPPLKKVRRLEDFNQDKWESQKLSESGVVFHVAVEVIEIIYSSSEDKPTEIIHHSENKLEPFWNEMHLLLNQNSSSSTKPVEDKPTEFMHQSEDELEPLRNEMHVLLNQTRSSSTKPVDVEVETTVEVKLDRKTLCSQGYRELYQDNETGILCC
ncbi:hypothetical protein V6N13_065519 [Hibiscus sabdariffa]